MEITRIHLGNAYEVKMKMREVLIDPREPTPLQVRLLEKLSTHRYRDLVATSLFGDMTFEESFASMCYALRASNAHLDGRFFGACDDFGPEGNKFAAREMLSGLAMKEAWVGLTPAEVAGLVTATMMDVVRFPSYGERVIETCGMGGDRGVHVDGDPCNRKTINGSTLSALTLASLGIKTAKHGSYSNTSAVGSTEAIERFGVVVDIPSVSAQEELAMRRKFHYTDAHAWKTVHDLSHLQPRRETVNHVIGPMTPPVGPTTRLDKVLGVNDKMDPRTIAKAYELLDQHDVFRVGNVAVVGGLFQPITTAEALHLDGHLRKMIVLDELSPVASAVAFVQRGRYAGMYILTPADFGVAFPNRFAPFIKNEGSVIHEANLLTLSGTEDNRQLVDLLAMNAALGLYLVEDMDDDRELSVRGPSPDALKACFQRCRKTLMDGRVRAFLDDYVQLTHELSRAA